jgi:CHAT domain-containing protein/uncharacterized protein HemY
MRSRLKSVTLALMQFSLGIATLLLSLSPSLLPTPYSPLPALAQTSTANSRKAEAERLLEQGNQQLNSFDDERNQAALHAFQKALEIARELPDRTLEGKALSSIGEAYLFLSDSEQAIASAQQSLALARELPNRELEAASLSILGAANIGKDAAKSLAYQQQALTIVRELNNPNRPLEVKVLRRLGHTYRQQKDYPQAIDAYQHSLEVARAIRDRDSEKSALNQLSNAYQSLQQYPKAIEMTQQLLGIAREESDRFTEINQLSNLGDIYYSNLNDNPKAIEVYQQALQIAETIQRQDLQIDGLLNIARSTYQIAKTPSDYQNAIELAQRGLKLAQNIKDVSRQARALAVVGNSYRQLKDYPNAIAAYEQSITAAREAKELNREVALLNGLAGLYSEQLNDRPNAIKYYQQALQVAEKLNDRGAQADALLNTAYSSWQFAKSPSDYRPVIELAQRGLKLAQNMKDASRQARALAILANTYRNLNDYPQAIAAYEQSIAAAREANDSNREAAVLNSLGNLYNEQLNDNRKAIEYYQQALQVAAKLNERESQADALLNIANSSRQIATSPSDYQKIIELAQQALKLAQDTNNRSREARALALLGDTYQGLQEYTKAIEYYQQSITTAREAKDEWRAAKVLNALGDVYNDSLNNYQKALEYYQQGLRVAEKLQNPALQIEALLNIANSSRQLVTSQSDYQKIIELAQRGLKLAQDTLNRAGEARALVILGMAYNSNKDYPKAIELLEQSLAIAKDTKDEYRESDALTSLSNTYYSLKDYPKAINYAQQALTVAQKSKNSELEAIALLHLASTHYDLGAYSEALTYTQQIQTLGRQSKNKPIELLASFFLGTIYYVQGDDRVTQIAQQNLLLARESQNPSLEAYAIWGQGWLYADSKDYTKALSSVQQSLTIAQKIQNQNLESASLALLGQIYHKQGKSERAITAYRESLALNNDIFGADVGLARVYRDIKMPVTAITYYKQAISKTEKIRTNIRELSTDFQKSFLGAILDIDRTKNADIYRELADVLISQGRITEAQQVLELLKVQELNDFSNQVRAGDQLPSVELNETEQKIKEKHGTLITFGKRLDECEQTQCSTLKEFRAQLNQLNQDFTQQIQRIEQETQENRVTQVSQGTEDFIASADKIVSAQPNTVLIYPLVLPDKVRLLWASKGGVLNSQVCPMGEAQLWQTISEFRDLLKTPNSDIASVKATGKKLYDCLVKPLESELQKNNIQNLVFVPDRATNYIPMGALFDGEKFLIERYSVSSVLNAGLTDVSDRLPPTPQNTPVLALGLSDAKAGFKALPNVPLELDAIVRQQTNDSRGIYPGAEFLNQTFTLDALQNNLRDRKILHIATHGSFVPKNPKESYLLLGNGDKYPIYQIQYLRNLRDIHLVVLSACETALGGPDASGTEIAGISSYFLRDKAKAVMASLWLVNDGSTSLLMQQFYNNLSTDKQSITKAQALRQAQLSLLNKQVAAKDAPQRSDAEVILEAKPGAQLPRSRTPDFSHPYYWAPFILIGNSL